MDHNDRIVNNPIGHKQTADKQIVGTSVPRKEGRDKVTGQAQYIDDMTLPGMLYGATVRSRIPRGKSSTSRLAPASPGTNLSSSLRRIFRGKN